MRWLICAFVVCILKSFSQNWVKTRSCKFKYTRTVNERPFRPFFSYLKASNCCGKPNFRHAPSSAFLVCEHLCPWQDCADVQARLSLRWLHVREVPCSFHRQPNVKHDAEACINHFSSWFVRLCVRVMIHRNHLMCKTHNTIS